MTLNLHVWNSTMRHSTPCTVCGEVDTIAFYYDDASSNVRRPLCELCTRAMLAGGTAQYYPLAVSFIRQCSRHVLTDTIQGERP